MSTSGSAKRVTAADVARYAGVSQATVSYVLNDARGQTISAQTRTAVHRAAQQLGYRPNLVARNLRTGGSGLVLYVVPPMALGGVLMEVASRLTTALSGHGIVLSLQVQTDDPQDIIEAIHNLQPLAVTSVFPLTGQIAKVVEAAGLPQIYLGSSELRALSQLNDMVGRIWVEHLAAAGHRRLAFVYSDEDTLRPQGDFWLAGLKTAVAERHLAPVVAATATGGPADDNLIADWHRRGVTAVCGQTDAAGVRTLHAVRRLGLRCPQDIAIVGADSGQLAELSDPPLTSIAFHATPIANASVAAILAQLGLQGTAVGDEHPFASLVKRASS